MTQYKQDPLGNQVIEISLNESNFSPVSTLRKQPPDQYLIIGFDTEYQSTFSGSSLDHELLSYQYSCEIIYKDKTKKSPKWSGIVLPDSPKLGDRLYIKEFVEIAISEGLLQNPNLVIPRQIYLVAHFTRADVPGFIDFKQDKTTRKNLNLQNLRNTFVNVSKDIPIELTDTKTGKANIAIKIKIRDTIHLSPQGSKSLEDLGFILNFEKIKLADTESKSIQIKKNMKKLLETDWDLFKRYAIRDAEVCTRYTVDIIRQYFELTGKFNLPLTLTSIGVDLLCRHWKDNDIDPLCIVGKEIVKESSFNKRRGHYQTKRNAVYFQNVFWSIDFVTECYHGGRNEQYWFGPCIEDIWFDYDLQSAYPSAMSLIGIPDWSSITPISDLRELLSCLPVDLAFANVDFEFPEEVKYPCLPVRTDKGIIFPRKGNTSTHISEIKVAEKLDCKFVFKEGRFVESKRHPKGNRVFQGFLKNCIEKRNQHQKKTFMNLFWKEVANSTYGKVAQGLRKRRIYDLKEEEMKLLEESKVSNPFFASYITAFCRGTLSEIMNNLPDDRIIFSVTTDGFLTNANQQDIVNSTKGVLSSYYKDARQQLVGDELIYEVKHVIRQPLGWRTRGQSTIKHGLESDHPGTNPDDRIVLAKGGIKLPDKLNKSEENSKIVNMFLNREPYHSLPIVIGLGIKDMYTEGKDFIDKTIIKRLSMEFDWKRKPNMSSEMTVQCGKLDPSTHLLFNTNPWDSTEQFFKVREIWNEYQKSSLHCLKTQKDYDQFAEYLSSKLSLNTISQKYLKKKDGDIYRLRRDLIIAWRLRKSGTHLLKHRCFGFTNISPTYKLTAKEFADILNDKIDIPCSKSDVDNGIKQTSFTPHQVPNTQRVRTLLSFIKLNMFPQLVADDFLSSKSEWNIDTLKSNINEMKSI